MPLICATGLVLLKLGNIAEDFFARGLNSGLQDFKRHEIDEEVREILKDFNMRDAAPRIKFPTLITHGANDRLMNVEGAKRLYDAIGAEDRTFKIYDDADAGGTGHCQYDIWGTSHPYVLDRMEERL